MGRIPTRCRSSASLLDQVGFQLLAAANVLAADEHLGHRHAAGDGTQADGGGILAQHQLLILDASVDEQLLGLGAEGALWEMMQTCRL